MEYFNNIIQRTSVKRHRLFQYIDYCCSYTIDILALTFITIIFISYAADLKAIFLSIYTKEFILALTSISINYVSYAAADLSK